MYHFYQSILNRVYFSAFRVTQNLKHFSFKTDRTNIDNHPGQKRHYRVRAFFADERGLNTVELVVIIAIVIGLALLFRSRITAYVTTLLDAIFSEDISKDLVSGLKPD